jgi:deoxycytidylate deaminase
VSRAGQGRKDFFFCKKRSKKTFIRWVHAAENALAQIKKSFLLLFLKKKKRFLACLNTPCKFAIVQRNITQIKNSSDQRL